jgi:hypothetical protein
MVLSTYHKNHKNLGINRVLEKLWNNNLLISNNLDSGFVLQN